MLVEAMLDCVKRRFLPAATLFASVVLAVTADASIVLPDPPSFGVGEAVVGAAATAGHSSTNDTKSPVEPFGNSGQVEHESPHQLLQSTSPAGASSSGASSASGIGGPGSSSLSYLASGVVCIPANGPLGWYLGGFLLAVPDPPGSDLLHVPRDFYDTGV